MSLGQAKCLSQSFRRKACPSLTADLWFGLSVANKTPGERVQNLSKEIYPTLEEPGFREKYAAFGVHISGSTTAKLCALINADGLRWSGLIRAANVNLDLVPKPRHVSFE